MSRSQHKLKLQSKGKIYTCDMYTTPEEARNYLYAGKYVRFKKNGVNLYVPLTATLNSAAESTPMLVYKKGDNTKYCIAQKSFFRANVTPIANAVITAKAYNESGTQIDSWTSGAKWFPYGTRIVASGVGNPSNIWQTPTLIIDRGHNTGETMTVSNVEISSKTQSIPRKSYSFSLNAGSNQTVTLKYTQPGSSQVSVNISGTTRSFTVLAGTTWSASITSVNTGYDAGSLNKTSGTITDGNTVITATAAALKTFTMKLNGTTNQTITVRYTQPGAGTVTKTSTGSAQSWTVKYGTTWTASISPNSGYAAGTLSGAGGTVYGAVTISATAAVFLLTVTVKTAHVNDHPFVTVTYTNSEGRRVTSARLGNLSTNNFIFRSGTTVSINADADWDYIWVYEGSTRKAVLTGYDSWTSAALTGNNTYVCEGHNHA